MLDELLGNGLSGAAGRVPYNVYFQNGRAHANGRLRMADRSLWAFGTSAGTCLHIPTCRVAITRVLTLFQFVYRKG